MLDQAGVNSMVLFQKGTRRCVRRKYLFELGLQLAKPYMERRVTTPLTKELKSAIQKILNGEQRKEQNDVTQDFHKQIRLQQQTRCAFCEQSSDRKQRLLVLSVQHQCTNEHRYGICQNVSKVCVVSINSRVKYFISKSTEEKAKLIEHKKHIAEAEIVLSSYIAERNTALSNVEYLVYTSEKPKIHTIYSEITQTVKTIMACYINDEIITNIAKVYDRDFRNPEFFKH
jgi:hypothetical protein